MNIFTATKGEDPQGSVPGCMGRMINIFDLSAGMAGTKLLTEKAHRDRSPGCRGRSEVAKEVLNPVGSQMDDMPVTNTQRRTFLIDKSSGTAVKMLMSQEMSKEAETARKSPGVVAKLMGLDALPAEQLARIVPRVKQDIRIHDRCTIGEAIQGRQQQQNVYSQKTMTRNVQPSHTHVNDREYKDVYEIQKKPPRTSHFKVEPLPMGSYHDKPSEKRMAFVHQKFMEAKQLAKNQNLLQSKEFQDALEVLSSNKDIFLKFLEGPSLQFSRHLYEKRTASTPNKVKRITVLKPSKALDMAYEKQLKKETIQGEVLGWDDSSTSQFAVSTFSKSSSLSQPTRIVVLKPSPRQPHDLKALITSCTLHERSTEDYFQETGIDERRGSREVAKELTRQMRENLSSNRRDEMLLSSVLSNGYAGDESSFSRSEIMHFEEECGSDSQVVTPNSRHSWDYINRCSSPCSFSSFSRASYSPESSVIREAKKRLSERLAMVTPSGIREVNEEHKQLRRSSSTLGEMLAVSETIKEKGSDEESFLWSSRTCAADYDLNVPSLSLSSHMNQYENNENLHSSLQRSKSVPSSYSAYENIELNMEVPDSDGKSVVLKEMEKTKSLKFSFKGKVSSFFSRKKRPSQEKILPSPSDGSLEKIPSSDTSSSKKSDLLSQCVANHVPEEAPMSIIEDSPTNNPSSTSEQGPAKEALSIEKPILFEVPGQNMEQPSPVSVLEALFEEDTSSCSSQYRDNASLECHRIISKSPLIESVARSLSWEDDARSEETPKLKNHPSYFLKVDNEEQERIDFVKSLLSSSGLDNETPRTALAKWHSIESPLNPLLLDKFIDRKEEDAKFRERRSRQRLLFDCVNAALLETSKINASDVWRESTKTSLQACNESSSSTSLIDEVLGQVAKWFSANDRLAASHSENSSLMVDCIIKKEVFGRRWAETMCLEITEIEKDIERQVLEELVGETLDGFISR